MCYWPKTKNMRRHQNKHKWIIWGVDTSSHTNINPLGTAFIDDTSYLHNSWSPGFGQSAWHLVIVSNRPMPKVCHKWRSSCTIANLNQVEDSKLIRIHVTKANLVTFYKIFDMFNVKNDGIILRSMHLEIFILTLNCGFFKKFVTA